MTLDVRRWNVRHLVGASAAYWTVLAAGTLAPFARVVAPLLQPSGAHGSVSAPDAAPGSWSDRDAAAPRGVPVERRENRG